MKEKNSANECKISAFDEGISLCARECTIYIYIVYVWKELVKAFCQKWLAKI